MRFFCRKTLRNFVISGFKTLFFFSTCTGKRYRNLHYPILHFLHDQLGILHRTLIRMASFTIELLHCLPVQDDRNVFGLRIPLLGSPTIRGQRW